MNTEAARVAVESVEGYDAPEPRGVRERYIAWASGRQDDGMAFMVAGAKHACDHPIAELLFDLYLMEAAGACYALKARRVKDWGYQEAADFVSSRRGSSRVRGYRIDWGRQAARDGLCHALWGHLRGTGLADRAKHFGIGERPYQRVRDHVHASASGLVFEFEWRLSAANALDLASYR